MTAAAPGGGGVLDANDGGPQVPAAASQKVCSEPREHATSLARQAARARLRAQRDHLAVARWLHQLVPLTAYYRQPKGAFYCRVAEGWAA